MIGGADYSFEVSKAGLSVAADAVASAVRDRWPEAVFETGDSADVMRLADANAWARHKGADEFFFFASAQVARSWSQDGSTSSNRNTMLHVLLGDDPREITLVVDDLTDEMLAWLEAIRRSIYAAAGPTPSFTRS